MPDFAAPPPLYVRCAVRTGDGTVRRPGYPCSVPGLAITSPNQGCTVWQLSHLASGLRVASGRSWSSPAEADRCAVEKLAGFDWTRSAEEIAADDGARAAVEELGRSAG